MVFLLLVYIHICIPEIPTVLHYSLLLFLLFVFSQHGVSNFLQLLRSFYRPSLNRDKNMPANSILVSCTYKSSAIFQSSHELPVYDIKQLEENIVDKFVAGKPTITSCNSLRTVFNFKKQNAEIAGKSVK